MTRKYVGRRRLYAAILKDQLEHPNHHPFNMRSSKPSGVCVRYACTPSISHCLDRFYGEIDRRIREWDFQCDLALRCPYAVARDRRMKRDDRAMYRLLRADAIRRGLV